METSFLMSDKTRISPWAFNFLASLINGNVNMQVQWLLQTRVAPFNFLASLINGNPFVKINNNNTSTIPFNFLASLINGN